MERKLIHGSTFSGIGAPEVAAEMLGWTNAFHCEINTFGRNVLDYYFPNAKSYDDITKTDFTEWRGRIDVLTGGFPCQPFSYAGKRRGSQDDRYLWPFMLRCINQIRPTWFVGENVAGITTMVFPGEDVKVGTDSTIFGEIDHMERRERYVIEEICKQLEDIGYSVQPMLIPACAVGAPHRRDRIFFIARNVADSNSCNNECRKPGEPTCEMREKRLQERNTVQQPFESVNVRPEMQGFATDTERNRRREIHSSLQPKLADGTESISNGRKSDASYTISERLERKDESWSSERRERLQVRRGATGYCGQNNEGESATDSDSRTINNRESGIGTNSKPSISKFGECYGESCAGISYLYPDNRWRTFPTVSPVYRGNDGFPFPVDNLTIPFSRWKKESLKAYGNAIVVQVMYEIFRFINEIENGKY